MTRNELQNELKKLGYKELCDDNKTLCAYNQIQYFLTANRCPIKCITKVYIEDDNLRIVLNGNIDLEAGYGSTDEL